MAKRHSLILVLVGAFGSLGATYPTQNFLVEAPTPQIAQQVGQWAEHYRKEKALQWLGQEMPAWSERCPLHVKVTMGGSGGATTFNFMNGYVSQTMQIEGTLDRLLASVLPHEVTHTVFAHYFRCPVPRWADEGGAVLSEDDRERNQHDQMVRQILNAGRAIPLRRLFSLRDYPQEMGTLYAEGYSVADFLVQASNRRAFLAFVAQGMQGNWDVAVQAHYHYQNVEQLEEAWLSHLRNTRRQPPTILAQNRAPTAPLAQNTNPAVIDPAKRIVVRLTVPPAQPLQDTPIPIIRAQSPEPEPGESLTQPTSRSVGQRPGYLPNYDPRATSSPAPHDPWQPPGARLGMPQFAPAPTTSGSRAPALGSPVGYPN